MQKFVKEIIPDTRITQIYVGMCDQNVFPFDVLRKQKQFFLTKPLDCNCYSSSTTVTGNIGAVVMLWCIKCDITIIIVHRPLFTYVILNILNNT